MRSAVAGAELAMLCSVAQQLVSAMLPLLMVVLPVLPARTILVVLAQLP